MQQLAFSQNIIDLNHTGQLNCIPQFLHYNSYDLNTGKTDTKVRVLYLNPVLTYNIAHGFEIGAHVRLKYAYNNVNSDLWSYFEVDYGLVARKIFKLPILNFINEHKMLKFKKRLYIYPYIEVRPYFGDHYIEPNGFVKKYSSIQVPVFATRLGVFINWGNRFSLSLGAQNSIEDRFSVSYTSVFLGVNYQYGKFTRHVASNVD
jgi:hypothetical protein